MILSEHAQRAIRHKIRAAGHLIAAEYDCELSDVLDIAVTAPFTPSQPNPPPLSADTPATHATGVQTDGAEGLSSSLPSSPSVDLSGLAAHEQGPVPSPAVPPAGDAAGGQAETLLSEPSVAPSPLHFSDHPDGGKNEVAPPSKPVTNRQRVRECHEAHPDWTAAQIAEAISLGAQQVRVIAHQIGVKPAKASPAKPQVAVEPPPAPKAQPTAKQPPATIPVARALPLPPPVVKPMQKGPQGRFYLKEKTEIGKPSRWVHQSLQPCPTGPGPLMTLDRKWAWYDTMDRFKGAVKKWPELKDMRKEATSHA